MRSSSKWLLSGIVGLLFILPASAQQSSSTSADQTNKVTTAVPDTSDTQGTPPPADAGAQTPAPAATPPAPPTWSVGPIDFSGTIDANYSFNFNHPRPYQDPDFNFGAGNRGETNFLYNFDSPANTFSLNLVKLGMSHQPDPVGFEFDLMFGNTVEAIRSVSSNSAYLDNIIENAYVMFKPMKAKGFEVDFGKFVTTAGAEVIESYSNWNYSRSLLFSFAIPYYHFGMRTSWPIGKHWTGGFQLVNGWNNEVNINTGATLGANLTGTWSKFSWIGDWYGGPGNSGSNSGWKQLFDTTLTLTPSSKVAAYVNYDYGWQDLYNPNGTICCGENFSNGTPVHWQGIAGALHIMPNSKWSVTGRYEWFDDANGFAMLGASLGATNEEGAFPVPQHVQEFTGTVEYKFLEGLMWRGEYRYDFSNEPFFLIGPEPLNCTGDTPGTCPSDFGLGNSKHQQTLTFAVIAYFGPKR